jgi:hypothetical protein
MPLIKTRQLWIKLEEPDIKLLTRYARAEGISRAALMRIIIMKFIRQDMRKSFFTQTK